MFNVENGSMTRWESFRRLTR